MLRGEADAVWTITVNHLLADDQKNIVDIVNTFLTEATQKNLQTKARGKDRALAAVKEYLQTDRQRAWSKGLTSLYIQGSERAIAATSADIAVNYKILHPNAIAFAQKNSAKLITDTSRTTQKFVEDVLAAGIEEGHSVKEISQLLQDGAGFSKARATLIARTETTRIFSGAPIESLSAVGRDTGRTFLKTWFGVMDAKERDEHVALEGETVGIDANFSNGLQYPSEPNCRCMTLTHEAEE